MLLSSATERDCSVKAGCWNLDGEAEGVGGVEKAENG